MLSRLRRYWRWSSQRRRIAPELWQRTLAQLPLLAALGPDEQARLHELASLLLREKAFVGAGGLQIDDAMRVYIAAQACLLILNLGLDYYDGWHEIILYPDTFVVHHEEYDEAGVVHETRRALEGESWERGPLVLSWNDVCPQALTQGEGANVIVHEFAHKLDMLNGAANGMPPLHADMSREAWTEVFTEAYETMCQQLDSGEATELDAYAAQHPAEFFAVMSEAFFAAPRRLYRTFPAVYRQLSLFYRQDPLAAGAQTASDRRPTAP